KMRQVVSDTAEFGDYKSGERVITEQTRAAMRQVLKEIQDGSFAKEWIAENESGRKNFLKLREDHQGHEGEKVGAQLRGRMPSLKHGKEAREAATRRRG